MKDENAIIWIDAECTGTDHDNDEILEIAAVITDMSGENKSVPFQSLFQVSNLSESISNSDEKVQKMHEESMLWHDIWLDNNTYSHYEIEKDMHRWIDSIVGEDFKNLYFGGNSIILDRNFTRVNLSSIYDRISFRSIDVTTLSLTLQSNFNVPMYKKEGRHRALPDVLDSIEEYRYYLQWLNKIN